MAYVSLLAWQHETQETTNNKRSPGSNSMEEGKSKSRKHHIWELREHTLPDLSCTNGRFVTRLSAVDKRTCRSRATPVVFSHDNLLLEKSSFLIRHAKRIDRHTCNPTGTAWSNPSNGSMNRHKISCIESYDAFWSVEREYFYRLKLLFISKIKGVPLLSLWPERKWPL